jgi:RNA polymerase sigma-70 factor (ECF subfamily)
MPIRHEQPLPTNDQELACADAAMERYANGEEAAFAEVYDALAPRLYRFLISQCRERSGAEDLLQQTFLRIHQARGGFVRGSRVAPWAFAIARRLAINHFHARGRAELGGVVEFEQLPSRATADGELYAKQLTRIVDRKLEDIPETQRCAFELVRRCGLAPADAAAVLGVSVMTVKLRTHRAVNALRAAIKEVESGAL